MTTMEAVGRAGGKRRFVTVCIGREWFALDAAVVLEILEDVRLETVPAARPGLLGMMAWRGGWLPAIDGAEALGTESAGAADARTFLVLGRGTGSMALGVRSVGEVRHLTGVAASAELLGSTAGVRTVVRLGDEFVSVLEADLIFPLDSEQAAVPTASESDRQYQIVTFRIADQEFGLDVFDVQEIVRRGPITPVPEAPDFVEGVMDLRGTLVPVIDFRKRLESPAENGAETRIVITPFEDETLGLVVDSVSEVMRVDPDRLSDPPDYVRGISARYVSKMARVDDRVVVVLDMNSILSSDERIQLKEADWETLVEDDAGGVEDGEAAE